jgi:hypothetical protein
MTDRPCAHEDTVLAAALDSSRVCPTHLAEHLAACDGCRDLYVIATALQDDHAAALADVRVPSAGQAWWRAELRARQEAAAIAARPITVATGIAAASLLGLLASVAGALAWWLRDSLTMPSAAQPAIEALMAQAWGDPTGPRLAIWLCGAVLLVATPVLLYVALTEE